MIPVKLTLKNFMAYRQPETLDLTGIHLACLSGENGAGKSALLDAITWALWGKARVNQSDELIHLGETNMSVELVFSLNETLYRALRRRSIATKAGKTELHLQTWVPEADGWRTLTENTIRQTQAKINRLLRLDYDTFINSAFLLQGRADEFTTKKPAERKQILADILGLGIYDEYEERARDQVREYGQQIKEIEGQLAQMEREIGREAAYRQEWQQHKSRSATLHKSLRAAEDRLNELRQQHKELTLKETRLADLQKHFAQAQTDLDELARTIAHSEQRVTQYRQIIARKADIEAGYKKLRQTGTAMEDWNNRLAQYSDLAAKRHQLEGVINKARSAIETQLQVKQSQLADLTPKVEAIDALQTELQTVQARLAALAALETERDAMRETLVNLQTEKARLTEENKQLKTEMDKIKERLTQLEEAGSTCPVCAQPLNEAHRRAVKAQFTDDGTTRGDTHRANAARLKAIEAEYRAQTKHVRRTEAQLKEFPARQGQLARLQQQLQEAQSARNTLETLAPQLAALQAELAQASCAPEATVQLAQVEQQLTRLDYDSQAHRAAKKQGESLAHFEEDWRTLQDAQVRLQEESARLERDRVRQTRLLSQTAADRDLMAALQSETEKLPQVVVALQEASAQVDALQLEERLARDAVAAARQKLDYVARLAKERGQKEDALVAVKELQQVYKELRVAFGKNGVQAQLIEHAIPELEVEANEILARMTDGRVNLQFITHRSTKTTDSTIETLDIRIADELGARNYDLYSGGEAFRVNFAVRIALSKLLARRAGANLQTLVIDEGFGTQDAQGRERLVEAINAIQDDFAKVIVITHIDELQSLFPTQIRVQKTPQGSRVTLY